MATAVQITHAVEIHLRWTTSPTACCCVFDLQGQTSLPLSTSCQTVRMGATSYLVRGNMLLVMVGLWGTEQLFVWTMSFLLNIPTGMHTGYIITTVVTTGRDHRRCNKEVTIMNKESAILSNKITTMQQIRYAFPPHPPPAPPHASNLWWSTESTEKELVLLKENRECDLRWVGKSPGEFWRELRTIFLQTHKIRLPLVFLRVKNSNFRVSISNSKCIFCRFGVAYYAPWKTV